MAQIFPDQTIPEKDKNQEWCSKHLDYAELTYKSNDPTRDKMSSDYMSYNGVKKPGSMNYLTKTYGAKNRAKFISYRAHIPKIQLRVGEFLTQPLAATVETTNREAKSEKMRRFEFQQGAMVAREELLQLKDKVGVDVMEGAPIPQDENDPIWQKMSTKDKEEQIMQIILDESIKFLDLKMKFSEDVLNGTITSMMFSKTERDEQGETRHISIDPREAIFEEVKGDMFLEKSPILGSCIFMTVHDALLRYRLTAKQRELLKQASLNPAQYMQQSNGFMKIVGGNLLVAVMHIEWKSVSPLYEKRVKKTESQLSRDLGGDDYIDFPMEVSAYEGNKDWHDKQVEKGKYEIVTKYREQLWEATRIGGLKELDVNCRPAYFQMRKVDDPTRIFGGSYTGFLCQTVDGKRISLMNEMENLSNILDIVMYKILSDVIRSKGKAIGFNLAALHKDSSVEKTMSELFNDGLVTYDTAGAGNMHGRDTSLNNMLQEFDIGLSNSFPALVQFKNDILDMMDRMTGINENRTGQIQASSTASNANTSIQASRTITAAFDFGVYLYITKVLNKIVESVKITWAFYKLEKGEQILGTDKFNFLKATQDIGYKDYGVHIQDGSKYAQIKQYMTGLMEASLNAKELRPEDALKFMLEETFAGQKAILQDSWAKIKEIESQSQQANMQGQQQMQEQQLQQQIQLAQEDREDRQINEKDNIVLQAEMQMKIDDNKSRGKVIENDHKISLEAKTEQNY
jgi:hypothetical protein